ncbi:MAG: sulfotransferase [Methylocella sp.]
MPKLRSDGRPRSAPAGRVKATNRANARLDASGRPGQHFHQKIPLDAAETHCDSAIALDRRYPLAYYLRSDLRIQTADRNNIVQMEVLIEDGKLYWRSEVLFRFALGKEYEDLEEHGRAFGPVKAGADLQRRRIGTQTRTWLARAPAGFAAAEPIFVAGLPRTGTTHVERIIASNSAMISAGETGAFAVEARAHSGGLPQQALSISPYSASDTSIP